jgi:hypothetical protein
VKLDTSLVPRSEDIAASEVGSGDRLLMVFAIAVGLGSGYCVRRLVSSEAIGAYCFIFGIAGSFCGASVMALLTSGGVRLWPAGIVGCVAGAIAALWQTRAVIVRGGGVESRL